MMLGWILFTMEEMQTTSMEPTIRGQGDPPGHHGDEVLILNCFYRPLKKGDLVVVTMTGGNPPITTIRRVAGTPGDPIPGYEGVNNPPEIGDGHYYLLGESTNAIDSRQLGLFGKEQITGKVLYVIHSGH